MYKYDVYLGGTCINSPFLWDWRTDFIRMLDDSISYYDPFIRKWKEHQSDVNKTKNNDNKRKESKYCVFVFTSDIIEVNDDSYRFVDPIYALWFKREYM